MQPARASHPPPAPPQPPPDPKLLALQARLQADGATAAHEAQAERDKAGRRHPSAVQDQVEIELARLKAGLDAKIALLDVHRKAAAEQQKMQRFPVPGSRKARDGHHYVPDPKRLGKFLMVVHHV